MIQSMPDPTRLGLPPASGLGLAALFLSALAGLVALTLAIDPAAPAAWEVDLARSIQEIGGPGWTPFIDVTEVLSRPLIVSVVAAAVGLLCLRWGRRREAAVLAGALLVWIPERLMTEFIARERPTEATLTIIREGYGFAFPSGHTTGALVIYGALLLLLLGSRYRRRPAGIAVCALAVAGLAGAGVGRVVLGAHWPTDVVGAALLSFCWLVGIHWADRRCFRPAGGPANGAGALDCPQRPGGSDDSAPGAAPGGRMRRPDRVDLFLIFQSGLIVAFLGVLLYAIGDWIGYW